MLAASRVTRRLLGLTAFTPTSSGVIKSKHTLPDLPYAYKALEPVISGDIMQIHHQKHHATYVNNLNTAEDQLIECSTAGY